jgi:hypothetical protein
VVELGWCKRGERVGITAGPAERTAGHDVAVSDPRPLSGVPDLVWIVPLGVGAGYFAQHLIEGPVGMLSRPVPAPASG